MKIKNNYTIVILLTSLLTIYFFIILRTAWLCDDAYITFRVIENFINGYGLRWNVAERVQAFTHPLWLFLITPFYYFTREFHYTVTILSIFVSLLAAVVFTLKISKNIFGAILGLIALILSKAFTDFSTSGLENPLSYLLIVIFFWIFLVKKDDEIKLFWLSLVSSLILINRLDLLLIILPVFIFNYINIKFDNKIHVKKIKFIFTGFIPLFIWELFSIIYYGFPFPNTYYDKLNTGVSDSRLIVQGLNYLLATVKIDPITAFIVVFSFIYVFFSKNWRIIVINLGSLLYLFYVIKIGGDFMAGRFIAIPFFVSIIALSQTNLSNTLIKIILLVIVLSVGLTNQFSPIYSDSSYPKNISENTWFSIGPEALRENLGIVDERAFYYPVTGLFAEKNIKNENNNKTHDTVEATSAAGFCGFMSGYKTYVIDQMGLGDPLMARLPIASIVGWRIGHYIKYIPCGYIDSVRENKNLICDSNLNKYYEKIIIITRDNIFSFKRFKIIINFNLKKYDYLISKNYKTNLEPLQSEGGK